MCPQRIMLVDDHEVVRLGLKSLIEHHPGFEVVAEAGSAKEAVEKAASLDPDVILMDIRLPGASGIEACEQILRANPETKVIMLTSYAEDEMLFSAIRAGASGYLAKTNRRAGAGPGDRTRRARRSAAGSPGDQTGVCGNAEDGPG